jgi:aminoglycoside phosphotransferase (APT) family kinase protein
VGGARSLEPAQVEALAWFLVSLHHHSQSVPAGARHWNESLVHWQSRRLFGPFGAGAAYAWRRRLAARGGAVAAALEAAEAALQKPGTSLVHGDFTPGNWLVAGQGNHVVDAEFSFFGCPEFDAGALLAGLLVMRQPRKVVEAAVRVLGRGCFKYDVVLTTAFAAAQLGAQLDEASSTADGPRGAAASALMRRVVGALEAGSLEAVVPGRRRS